MNKNIKHIVTQLDIFYGKKYLIEGFQTTFLLSYLVVASIEVQFIYL